MKKITIIILFLTVSATLPAQIERGTVTDADGNIYPTAKLGDYWWMTENLRTKHFNNGDEITHYPDSLFPAKTQDGKESVLYSTGGSNYDYCKHFTYPNRDPGNEALYGLNYTWWAAMDERGLCPAGWILPDTAIWYNMTASIGVGKRITHYGVYLDPTNPAKGVDSSKATTHGWAEVGRYLKSASLWEASDAALPVTGSVGFNAVPSGDLSAWGYMYFGQEARFWTPNYVMANGGGMGRRYMALSCESDDLRFDNYRSNSTICIRCVKLAAEETAVQAVKPAAPDAVYTSATGRLLLKNIPAGARLSVYSVGGALQKRFSAGNPPESWDVSDLGRGVYILNIQGNFGSKQYKFIK